MKDKNEVIDKPNVSQKLATKSAMSKSNPAKTNGNARFETCRCLSEIVGRRLAMSVPTKRSMKMPRYGEGIHFELSASAIIAGVSTIQQPPGAGTPVK